MHTDLTDCAYLLSEPLMHTDLTDCTDSLSEPLMHTDLTDCTDFVHENFGSGLNPLLPVLNTKSKKM